MPQQGQDLGFLFMLIIKQKKTFISISETFGGYFPFFYMLSFVKNENKCVHVSCCENFILICLPTEKKKKNLLVFSSSITQFYFFRGYAQCVKTFKRFQHPFGKYNTQTFWRLVVYATFDYTQHIGLISDGGASFQYYYVYESGWIQHTVRL